ncbi:MAG: SLBB domain-containing protein, partial [Kovacikia sp.]
MPTSSLTQWLLICCQASLSTAVLLTCGTSAMAQTLPNNAVAIRTEIPDGDGYLLGSGDRVRVDFFSIPEFSAEYQVLPNGTINFPMVGAVAVQGTTLGGAAKVIADRFRPYLPRPVITLSLVAARPVSVTIAGEINRPGAYTLSAIPSTTGGEITVPSLTQTLQLAEGVTQAADLRKVEIRRQRPNAPGVTEKITVNLAQLLQTADSKQNVRLQDGDSIFIPATTAVNLEESRQLATANFATKSSRPLKIAVIGEVNRPGPYTITGSTIAGAGQGGGQGNNAIGQVPNVTQAIQVAGGITQTADIRNIQVHRLTRTGTEQVIKIDFWKLLKSGDVRQDLPIQDGDTIEIPTASVISDRELTQLGAASFSPDRVTVNIVGQVERPGPVTVQPNTPLNQALLAAGGFTRKAKKGSVTLIRLNPNGTVSKRDISVDFAQGVNEANNPALRSNDIVIVKQSAFSSITDAVSGALG